MTTLGAASYKVCLEQLSDTERKRLLCVFFFMPHSKIDMAEAAAAYGAAKGGFEKMYSTTMKKLRDVQKDGDAAAEANKGAKASESPTKGGQNESPKKNAKRKASEEGGSPVKKGRKTAKKEVITEETGDEEI